ncbi:MAG: ComEC/Rec2 family competence protein, partial [Nocardioides sp.]
MASSEPATGGRPHDLRMPALGAAAWLAGLGAQQVGSWMLLPVGLVTLAALAGRLRGSSWVPTLLGVALVAGAVTGTSVLRKQAVADNPLAALARERAAVSLTGTVISDPRPVAGRYADQVLVRVEVREVTGRGVAHRLATPVLVLGGAGWAAAPLGSTVRTSGLLTPSDDGDLAGVLTSARDPVVVARPDAWWRAAGAVRASVRDSVAGRPADQQALVPALVDGDDAGLDPA